MPLYECLHFYLLKIKMEPSARKMIFPKTPNKIKINKNRNFQKTIEYLL